MIEADCTLGAGCRLYANVSIGYAVRIGERVIIHPGAVIGADGFGIAFAGDHWEKVPQVGSVVIGNDCEIGANSCIDRGALGDTVLEDDCRLDNLVQIGHNVFVGAHTAIAAMGGAAGSATAALAGGSKGRSEAAKGARRGRKCQDRAVLPARRAGRGNRPPGTRRSDDPGGDEQSHEDRQRAGVDPVRADSGPTDPGMATQPGTTAPARRSAAQG